MNKDLEKIIHETAREIAVEIISNSRLEKPPTPDYRDVVINFASKVSSEVAMRVHTETQKLIDGAPQEANGRSRQSITDWRDLKVGDVVIIKSVNKKFDENYAAYLGAPATVCDFSPINDGEPVKVTIGDESLWISEFELIYRKVGSKQ